MALMMFEGRGKVGRAARDPNAPDGRTTRGKVVKAYKTALDSWCLLFSTEVSREYALEPGVSVNLFFDDETGKIVVGQDEDGGGKFTMRVNGTEGVSVMKLSCTEFIKTHLLPLGVEHKTKFTDVAEYKGRAVKGQTLLFQFTVPEIEATVPAKRGRKPKLVEA